MTRWLLTKPMRDSAYTTLVTVIKLSATGIKNRLENMACLLIQVSRLERISELKLKALQLIG